MPPVTGEPQHGGKEAADVASHEEGRPPDEIYEDDKMETSSRRFPPASVSKSTKLSDEDSEQLGPLAPQKEKRKGKINLNSEDIYPHYPQSEAQETVDEKTAFVWDAADALGLGPSDITEPHDDSWTDFDEFWHLDFVKRGKEKYPIRESGKLKHNFQEQRAWLVHGIWASIENVRKISSSLLVNKLQCEHIADHFKVIGDVLKKLGLGKDFVSGQALERGTGIQTILSFDEALFGHIADTFDSERHSYFWTTRSEDLSREFLKYIRELDLQVGSSKDSLFKKFNIYKGFKGSQDYTLQRMSMKEIVETRSGYQMQHRLDEFLCLLFEVLKYGEDLVLFHSGLEGANKGVVERTGLYGEKFVQIHELLYKLLHCYACLEHCGDTEFARGHWYAKDSCRAQSLLYYLNSNCLGESTSLSIHGNFLNVDLATKISELLERPNCVLKTLYIESSSTFKINHEELRKCRLLVIAALSKCVSIKDLHIYGLNGEEVHELCKSLRANRVLKNLDISIDEPLNDDHAMDLSVILKENHSLKSFTLAFRGISSEGAAYLGAVLTGKHKVILSVVDDRPSSEIPFKGESRYTQKLHLSSKTLTCVSIELTYLDRDAIFAILDSLNKSKTLQVLELDSRPRYGRNHGANREVAACLEALLAENSTIEELKVQIGAWDKCFVQHLLRPLMEKDGEPHVNISLRQLHIMISHVELSPHECGEVAESITQLLRTNKTLTHFSMTNAFLRTPDICEILDSLKTNKALQVLILDKWKWLDDPQVKIAFVDLLVNYNFTLSTIIMEGLVRCIETFMCTALEFDTKMILRELRSLIGTTSDSPIARSADDLKQVVETLQPKKGEGSVEEMCGSSKRAFDKDKSKVEAKDERPQIFLSYSKEMRNFARLLCKELKSSNYNVFDQDSINFPKVVDRCQLAIVILSDTYVNSKPSMSELCTIVESKKTNQTLKVYPLFYKLTLCNLQGIFLDTVLEKEALNFLCEGKNEVLRKANDLVRSLRQGKVTNVGKICEEFSELQRNSWPSNGLEFEKNTISEEGYLHAILEEIFHYMPVVECNNNQISRHQSKLEMESKLSLQQMNSLMESLPTRNFYLQRKFNMAKYLQEEYIQYSSFEKMCPLNWSPDQKQEYSKSRIAAALFPMTFLYHLKMQMFQGPRDGNFRPMLKASANFVVEKMQNKCNKNGVQTSTFFDFFDFGAPVDPKRIIAMCQNFPTKTSNASKQLVIVQDDLTRAYYYQYDEAWDLQNPALNKAIGVIGMRVASKEIHVDNIYEDGSSYSGVLGDFSYKFDSDENNQCAAKAFGDLVGARFLSKKRGIKCSPLLIVALASAIQKKGLILTWSNGKGHMEFDPKLALKVEVEVKNVACQIHYTRNINQLGLEIEWGTGTKDIVTNSGSNIQLDDVAIYAAAANHTSTYSCGVTLCGSGFEGSVERPHSKSKEIGEYTGEKICMRLYESKGGFYINRNLCDEHLKLIKDLCNCQLHQVHDRNFLVVSNIKSTTHVSIFSVEPNEAVQKFELVYITDIILKSKNAIKRIFKTGLKGRELTVSREGNEFNHVGKPLKPLELIFRDYQEQLLKFKKKFSSKDIASSMAQIKPNSICKLKSKNEWEALIGPQEKFRASYDYWWNVSPMAAIVYSRTLYSSGKSLITHIEFPPEENYHIGFCSIEDPANEFGHSCPSMVSRGKFSRPPGSLLDDNVLWGGYEIEHTLV